MTKYIFVMGGVCSSLGKGIAAASLALLLKRKGYHVTPMKFDPYLNVDPGTMSPERHGEVFVLDDGSECDLDLGHYERFLNQPLSKISTATMGRVYKKVLDGEREGSYLGRDIQIVPHITDVIKHSIYEAGKETDILIIEIGGTIGDIEGLSILEAIRQIHQEVPRGDAINVILSLLPYLQASKELKTKPTQMAVRGLQRTGLFPDIILARSDLPIKEEHFSKIALFCNVEREAVIPCYTAESIYAVPKALAEHKLHDIVLKKLGLKNGAAPDLKDINDVVKKLQANHKKTIKMAMVTKYNELDDAYLSVYEALRAAAAQESVGIEFLQVNSEKLEKGDEKEMKRLKQADAMVVPGGFGSRGVEGKIMAATYAREHKIPYLGICLGSQVLAIEFARNVANLEGANSAELDQDTPHPVVHIMESQKSVYKKGGTMRLGTYPCTLKKGTKAHDAYKEDLIHERHRHRYEFNNGYRDQLERLGLVISGTYEKENIVEIVEVKDHPFMVGAQFHPELTSRPTTPGPLFVSLIQATKAKLA